MNKDIDFSKLDELLASANLEEVDAESNEKGGFEDLPDGYYLTEVEKAELTTSKSSGNPMVSFRFTVVEDGLKSVVDAKGNAVFEEVKGSKNRKIFINWVLSDETKIKKFVSDMLKFEGEEPGTPLLEKEYFLTSETLEDALAIIVGYRIYVNISTTTNKKTEEKQTWQNLISWTRAAKVGLVESVDTKDMPI